MRLQLRVIHATGGSYLVRLQLRVIHATSGSYLVRLQLRVIHAASGSYLLRLQLSFMLQVVATSCVFSCVSFMLHVVLPPGEKMLPAAYTAFRLVPPWWVFVSPSFPCSAYISSADRSVFLPKDEILNEYVLRAGERYTLYMPCIRNIVY